MAWNPHSRVADCREISRKWGNGIEQVIIIGIDGDGRTVTATYGRTPQLCACADAFGKAAIAGILAAVAAAESKAFADGHSPWECEDCGAELEPSMFGGKCGACRKRKPCLTDNPLPA